MFAIAVGILLLSHVGVIKAAEHWTADWRTALFSTRKPSQHDHVALVLISDKTLAKLPYRIPIDRGVLAKLIRVVANAEPAAIGIDFAFVRKTDPEKDADLLAAIKEVNASGSKVVLGAIDENIPLPKEQLEFHRQFLEKAGVPTGHVYFERKTNIYGISDQVVRQMAEEANEETGQRPFAEVLAAVKRHGATPRTPYIAWLLPPWDGSLTFYELEASEILGQPEDVAKLLTKGLRNKIVLIGADLVDLDRHLTPMAVADEARTPGVKVHAQIVAQLVDDDRWLRKFNPLEEFLLLLVVAIAGFQLSKRFGLGRFPRTIAIVGSALLVGCGIVMFKFGHLLMPYTTALAAWLASISLGVGIDRLYRNYTAVLRFLYAKGGPPWRRLYRLGTTLGSRYWRGRL